MQTQLAEAFPCKAPYLSINGIPIHPMPEESCSRLLIVDDDPKLLLFLRDELSDAGHQCSCCNNGLDALLKLRQENFDLVLLDWTLPDFSGVEICQRLRSSGDTTSVLMLTARDAVDERVQALDAGADDYLTKPFELKELHARVRVRLRRIRIEEGKEAPRTLELGDLQIDILSRRVKRGERTINLSQREFDLLVYLTQKAEQVLPRQTILEAVWGQPFLGDPNTLDVYLGYLRRKLERPGLPKLLHTVRGVGVMARLNKDQP